MSEYTPGKDVVQVTLPPTKKSGGSQIFMDFGSFLQQQNVLGIAIGFLIAMSSMDTAKTFVRDAIMPIVHSMRTMQPPVFVFEDMIEATITFIITMFVAFIVVRITKTDIKPVPVVQVFS